MLSSFSKINNPLLGFVNVEQQFVPCALPSEIVDFLLISSSSSSKLCVLLHELQEMAAFPRVKCKAFHLILCNDRSQLFLYEGIFKYWMLASLLLPFTILALCSVFSVLFCFKKGLLSGHEL